MSDPLAGRYVDAFVGLALGFAAAAGSLAVWASRRGRRPGNPAAVAGLALAVAGVVAVTLRVRAEIGLAVALGILAGGGAALEWARTAASRPFAVLGTAAGLALGTAGVLLMHPGPVPRPVLVAATLAAGALLADFDRRWRDRGLTPALLAVTTAGIYLAVPDVEAALPVLGVALPLALLGAPAAVGQAGGSGGPMRPSLLAAAGAYAAAGLLVWITVTGSAGRPGAFIGGLACLGVLVVEPPARRLSRRGRDQPAPPPGRRVALAVLISQIVLAAVAARVVARPVSVVGALALAAFELVLALAVTVAALSYGERTAA
jgi:hypothetical protein